MKLRLLPAIALVLLLSACTLQTPQTVTPAPAQTVAPDQSPQQTTGGAAVQPTAEPAASPEVELDQFLGKPTMEAVAAMQPMLESVSKSVYTASNGFSQTPDSRIAWGAAHALLSNWWGDFGDVAALAEDGSVEVPGDAMGRIFAACFADCEASTAIDPAYASVIAYDSAKGVYRIARSDDSSIAYRVENVELDEGGSTAFIDITVLQCEGSDEVPYSPLGTVSVSVVPDSGARYGFVAAAATYTPAQQ